MREEVQKRVGDNMRLVRTFKNMSQDELADSIGSCRSLYTHYELGSRTPDPESLFIIAKQLDIDMSSLFEMDHIKFLNIVASKFTMTEDSKALVEIYEGLSPFHKGQLMERALCLRETEDDEIERMKSLATEKMK